MKAVVGYSDKTVDQVQAEIKAREAGAKSGRKRGSAPVVGGELTKGHVDALAALQAAAAAAKAGAGSG